MRKYTDTVRQSPRLMAVSDMAPEAPPFPWRQVRLKAEDMPPGGDTGWKSPQPARLGRITVGVLAARLIQRERARARRAPGLAIRGIRREVRHV